MKAKRRACNRTTKGNSTFNDFSHRNTTFSIDLWVEKGPEVKIALIVFRRQQEIPVRAEYDIRSYRNDENTKNRVINFEDFLFQFESWCFNCYFTISPVVSELSLENSDQMFWIQVESPFEIGEGSVVLLNHFEFNMIIEDRILENGGLVFVNEIILTPKEASIWICGIIVTIRCFFIDKTTIRIQIDFFE